MRWVQGWVDENLKVSNAIEVNSERIIKNDIYSDLVDDLLTGKTSKQAVENVYDKVNNNKFGYDENQKQIAKKLIMPFIKSSDPNIESLENSIKIYEEELEKQRQVIKAEMDIVAKIGNDIKEFSSPIDLSSENIAGEIENLTIGVGNQLVKAWGNTDIYWGIDDDLQTLLRQARKTNDIEDYKSVIKYVEDHPDQIKEFDLDPEVGGAGSVMEGRGAYITRGVKELGVMKEYMDDYNGFKLQKMFLSNNFSMALKQTPPPPDHGSTMISKENKKVTTYKKGDENSNVYEFDTEAEAEEFFIRMKEKFNNE